MQLADRLGAEVGDRLVATGETGAARELEVVGILATGLGAYDEATAIVNLPVAQGLAGWGTDEGSEIRVRTTSQTGLDALRARLEAVTGHRVETWEESNRASLQLFRTIGLTTYLLTGFVLVVAGLGIANKLTTIILDKERDIAILRAYGFSRGAVRAVFLIEGVLLGRGRGGGRLRLAALRDRLLHGVSDPLRAARGLGARLHRAVPRQRPALLRPDRRRGAGDRGARGAAGGAARGAGRARGGAPWRRVRQETGDRGPGTG